MQSTTHDCSTVFTLSTQGFSVHTRLKEKLLNDSRRIGFDLDDVFDEYQTEASEFAFYEHDLLHLCLALMAKRGSREGQETDA